MQIKKSALGGVLHKKVTQGGDKGVSGGGEQKQMVREESCEKRCTGPSCRVVLAIASTGRSHQNILHSF